MTNKNNNLWDCVRELMVFRTRHEDTMKHRASLYVKGYIIENFIAQS